MEGSEEENIKELVNKLGVDSNYRYYSEGFETTDGTRDWIIKSVHRVSEQVTRYITEIGSIGGNVHGAFLFVELDSFIVLYDNTGKLLIQLYKPDSKDIYRMLELDDAAFAEDEYKRVHDYYVEHEDLPLYLTEVGDIVLSSDGKSYYTYEKLLESSEPFIANESYLRKFTFNEESVSLVQLNHPDI